MIEGFLRDERGMIPYSAMGLIMLLITGGAILHFNANDLKKAGTRNLMTADMETFYTASHVSVGLQQVAAQAAEGVILEDSMSTYSFPINMDSWHEDDASYRRWKEELAGDLEDRISYSIYDYYNQGDAVRLAEDYSTQTTKLDFSEFLMPGQNHIIVEVSPDHYTEGGQKKMGVEVNFQGGMGIVKAENTLTGHTLSKGSDTTVPVGPRPFTMADKVYEFTGIFKKNAERPLDPISCIAGDDRDTVEEMAWYLWMFQEGLGLIEANTKGQVRFASDERVSYSLMQLIIAYKEMEHFGTFDYIHTTEEFLRPWMGSEGDVSELLGLLTIYSEGEGKRAIQGFAKSAGFMEEVTEDLKTANDYTVWAVGYLNKSHLNTDAEIFPPEFFPPKVPTEDATTNLQKAYDTPNLKSASEDLQSLSDDILSDKSSASFYSGASLPGRWRGRLDTAYSLAEDDYDDLIYNIGDARDFAHQSQFMLSETKDLLGEMEIEFEASSCESITAAQLYFGGDNGTRGSAGLKGFVDILPAKEAELENIITDLESLKSDLDILTYAGGKGDLDEILDGIKSEIDAAEKDMEDARDSKAEFDRYRQYYYACDSTCSGSSAKCSGCQPDPTQYGCWYTVEQECYRSDTCCDDEGECEECGVWYDCSYSTQGYRCPGSSRTRFKLYANEHLGDYRGSMKYASGHVLAAKDRVDDLRAAIPEWLEDKGYWTVMEETIPGIIGIETSRPSGMSLDRTPQPYSIMDFYYNHHSLDVTDEHPDYGAGFRKAINIPGNGEDITEDNYDDYKDMGGALSYIVGTPQEEFSDYGLAFMYASVSFLNALYHPAELDNLDYNDISALMEEDEVGDFMAFVSGLVDIINQLMATMGDVNTIVNTVQGDKVDSIFPNLYEHFLTTMPLPPVPEWMRITGDYQGFTLVRDYRIRVDNSPSQLKVDLGIGKVDIDLGMLPSIASKNGRDVKYAVPIPFLQPISAYSWDLRVTRSQVGKTPTEPDGTDTKEGMVQPETSTIWLIDYENNDNMAPLFNIDLGGGEMGSPFMLHKPILYQYEFTAFDYPKGSDCDDGFVNWLKGSLGLGKVPEECNHIIDKSFHHPLPVIIIGNRPFLVHFGPFVEPPDKKLTRAGVDVEFDTSENFLYSDDISAVDPLKVTFSQDYYAGRLEVLYRIYETSGENEVPLSASRGLFQWTALEKGDAMSISVPDRMDGIDPPSLVSEYGWSILRADAYTSTTRGFHLFMEDDIGDVQGGDHDRIVLVDSGLEKVDVAITEVNSEGVTIKNRGNKKVDVVLSMNCTSGGDCAFFEIEGRWERGMWKGTLLAGEERSVKALMKGTPCITLKVMLPRDARGVLMEMDKVGEIEVVINKY